MFTQSSFSALMVATFVLALLTMIVGVTGMGRLAKNNTSARNKGQSLSTTLMIARVGLSMLLLIEIIIYISVFKN